MTAGSEQPVKRKRRKIGDNTRGETIIASMPARYAAFIDGTLTVDDLDDEELARMQIRDSGGGFRGRKSTMIPRAFAMAAVQELNRRNQEKMMELFEPAQQRIKSVLRNGSTVHDGPGVTAALKVFDYVLGKPVEKIQLQADVKVTQYENIIDGATVELKAIESGEAEAGDI